MFSSVLPFETGIYSIALEAGMSVAPPTHTRTHAHTHTHTPHTYIILCRLMVILLDFFHSTAV